MTTDPEHEGASVPPQAPAPVPAKPSAAAATLSTILGSYMRRTLEAQGIPRTEDHKTEAKQIALAFQQLVEEAREGQSTGTSSEAVIEAIRAINAETRDAIIAQEDTIAELQGKVKALEALVSKQGKKKPGATKTQSPAGPDSGSPAS